MKINWPKVREFMWCVVALLVFFSCAMVPLSGAVWQLYAVLAVSGFMLWLLSFDTTIFLNYSYRDRVASWLLPYLLGTLIFIASVLADIFIF